MSKPNFEPKTGETNFSDPEWPTDLSYYDLIRIAFRDHLITDVNHPVLLRLRGLA
jgi:hypothetical protein